MGIDRGDIQLACFRLGPILFTIDVMAIREIIRYQKVTHLPKAPSFIEGIINLRGMVVPIVDLRKRFSIPPDLSPRCRIIIARVWDRIFGFVVDEVKGIIMVKREEILPTPKVGSPEVSGRVEGVDPEYLDGVVERGEDLLFLLNLDRILSSEERLILEGPRA